MNKQEFIASGILDILSKYDTINQIKDSNKNDILNYLKECATKLAEIYDNTLKFYEENRWPEEVITEVQKHVN